MTESTRVTGRDVPRPGSDDVACLVLIYPPGPDLGRRFVLRQNTYTIGRGSDCDIQIDRDSVSRRHAKIYRHGAEFHAADLGSTNGSCINNQIIHDTQLRDGDCLKIGSVIFKFLTGSNIENAYHEEIYRMTIMDGLTGVYNRRYFLEFLDREMARCHRYKRPLSLVMFDIDHFKRINDEHGHVVGDFVLKGMTERLLPRIRREELLARYGGEEFVVVLPEAGRSGALEFGEQLRQLVASEPFVCETTRLALTISVGVATAPKGNLPPDSLAFVQMADANLYDAKRNGRNCVVG